MLEFNPNRIRPPLVAGARAPMAAWIYVNTSKQIGDKDHIKLFATA
ncbi:hypothetical protein G6321_00053305 [Bradyrhizobium barranii subsp. barranii]|uniref:Uncharacterized protein n=1 Tax=Bradyrhizobium barranii subsp. barranii TaxID=2823807 RepID=A0A7Z0Q8B0_9BRAD|nr:hypothetical protein [Bradyrhizobium barranii]UGX94234.1 hypothetical protein G6321_00053305 [Bradyrhizobium barranii subsp. barranii]